MKKYLSGITIFVLIGIFIGGIFATQKSPTSNKTKIVYSTWGSESEIKILKPIILEYEKSNPNIEIEFLHIPHNYFQKLHLLFASNTEPDVIFINNLYLPIYINANVLEPLDNYFEKNELQKFYPKVLQAMKQKGHLYAIPRDVSNLVIYYNKDLFDKYGIKYPQQDWDFKKFLEISKKITHRPREYGVSFDEYPYYYLPYIMSEGGSFLPEEYKKSQTQKALDFYADLRKKYHVAPRREELSQATSAQLFLQGRLGMLVSGRWVVPKLRTDARFDWDIINFPKGSKGSITPLDSSGWAISKNSKHKKESVEFIKYLSNNKNISKMTQSGLIVPSIAEVAGSKVFLDGEKPQHSCIFIDIIPLSQPTPTSINYNEILDKIKEENEYRFN